MGDFLLIGSSGFWNLFGGDSKHGLTEITQYKTAVIKEMKANTKQADWGKVEKYEKGHELVEKSLMHIFEENFGKEPIVDGKPEIKKDNEVSHGYENISGFLIKMARKPKEYDGDDYKHDSDSAS